MTNPGRHVRVVLAALVAVAPATAQISVADVEARIAELADGDDDPALVGLWELRDAVVAADFEAAAERRLQRRIDAAIRRLDPTDAARRRRVGAQVDAAFAIAEAWLERRWPRSAVALASRLAGLDPQRSLRFVARHEVAGRALEPLAWVEAPDGRIDELRAAAAQWAADDRAEDAAAMLAAAIWHADAAAGDDRKARARTTHELRAALRAVDRQSLEVVELLEALVDEHAAAAERLHARGMPAAAAALLARVQPIAPELVTARLPELGVRPGSTLIGELMARAEHVFGPANWIVEPALVTIPPSKGDPWKDTAMRIARRELGAGEAVRIAADVWIGPAASGPAAIVFGYRNPKDLLMFHVWHRDAHSDVRMLRFEGEEFGPLREITHVFDEAERGDWMRMTVEIRGTRVRGKLGSSPWVEAELPAARGGRIGFYRDGGSTHPQPVHWRDLVIEPIDG